MMLISLILRINLIFSYLFYRTKKDIFPTRLFGSVEKLDDLIISAPENVEEISESLPHPRCGSLGMVSHKISITILGHKHVNQKFHYKIDIFHEKLESCC